MADQLSCVRTYVHHVCITVAVVEIGVRNWLAVFIEDGTCGFKFLRLPSH